MRLQPGSLFAALLFFAFISSAGLAAGLVPDFRSFADKIERQTGRTIAYSAGDIKIERTEFPDIEGMTAEQALRQVLDAGSYNLITTGNHIIIRRNNSVGTPDIYPSVENPPVTDEKTEPHESVFSGETRLIIIRDREVAADEIPSGATVRVMSAEAETLPGEAASVGLQSRGPQSVEEAGESTAQRIPFRWDLFEIQAYNNDRESQWYGHGIRAEEVLHSGSNEPVQSGEVFLRPFIIGPDGPEPRPATPDGNPTATEIPFRWDLYDTQAYTPVDEVGDPGSLVGADTKVMPVGPPTDNPSPFAIGPEGPEPRPTAPDGDPTAVAIPFRTDLIDTQVYPPAGESDTASDYAGIPEQNTPVSQAATDSLRPFVTGQDGPEPHPVEPSDDPTALEIPFRPDVAETQAYQPAEDTKTKTRRRIR